MMFVAHAADLLSPARAPEGRSHHGGQRALYLSQTPAGCAVAVRRYMAPGDPPRAVYPVQVTGARVADLRDAEHAAALGIDISQRAVKWQDLRARGLPSPTWAIADRVRALGLDGMLYASRSDPAKTHLTLFRWTPDVTTARVAADGPALRYDPAA